MIVHGLLQQTVKSVRLDQTVDPIPVTNSCTQLSCLEECFTQLFTLLLIKEAWSFVFMPCEMFYQITYTVINNRYMVNCTS